MTVSQQIRTTMEKSSWIRKMFEEGAQLKARHGADKVFDFSIGNPNVPPPPAFKKTLTETVASLGSRDHGYMPQAGYPEVCEEVADFITRDQGVAISGRHVLMTCGAAGALNIILKAILDPGDEVIVPTPCFVEYRFYTENHGGVVKMVTTRTDFSLDLSAISDAVGPNTKAVLINSPHNPTGRIYTESELKDLGDLLSEKSAQLGRTLYLISDEPYRKIVFTAEQVASTLACYPNSIVANSYSKDLSIPGERIGYAAVNPNADHAEELIAGLTLTNRILGFVNAPALMQRVVSRLQGASVDIEAYRKKRDLFCDGLKSCGYEFFVPSGAFYLFPRSPIADDVQFVKDLQKELILAVPGSGFAGPGHFRLAFCVDDETIVNAMPGFKRVLDRYR